VSTVTLRPWQRAAFELFRSSAGPDFLAVATPGAGKTTFALACARAQLADWMRDGSAPAPRSTSSNDDSATPSRGCAASDGAESRTVSNAVTGPTSDTSRGIGPTDARALA
jgi:hypothetical protein